MEKIKLFCIPYAGGSANGYLKWKKHLNENIELIPLELKGRGKRFSEKFYKNFDEIIDDLYSHLVQQTQNQKYVIFGHSMGALITYKLTLKIQKSGYRLPEHVFLSGREAPKYKYMGGLKVISSLPEKKFIEEIKKFGGISNEIIENKELLELFMPIIRSDFGLIEKLDFDNKLEKLNCNLTVMNGLQDITEEEKIEEWNEYTNKRCKIFNYNGGHFFIDSEMSSVLSDVNKIIGDFC